MKDITFIEILNRMFDIIASRILNGGTIERIETTSLLNKNHDYYCCYYITYSNMECWLIKRKIYRI